MKMAKQTKDIGAVNFQQGDVIITPVVIPTEAKPVEKSDRALAYGEVTGHSHRIKQETSGLVEFLKYQAKTYIRVTAEVELVHEEHNTIVLPPGDYQYAGTQEYDYDTEESRRVAD